MAAKEFSRRDVIRTSAVGAGVVASGLGGNFVAAATDEAAIKKTRSYNSEMEYRRLGATGLWVSAVCLGGHWKRVGEVTKAPIPAVSIPRKNKEAHAVLRKNRYDVLTRCMEVGINYVDACTRDEIATYGPALKGRRDKMYMAFAMWPQCPRNKKWCKADQILKTLNEGLKLAEVEYVDIWRLVASTPGRHTEADEQEFMKAFDVAKKQGKVRFTGVSSHGRPWLKRIIEKYPKYFQVILFPYTSSTKELPRDSLFQAIREQDIGSFGIKPFASNSLFRGLKTPEERSEKARQTIRCILRNPALTAPIPGLACVEEVDNMALAIKEYRKQDLTRAELEELEAVGKRTMANLPPEYEWLKDWQYV